MMWLLYIAAVLAAIALLVFITFAVLVKPNAKRDVSRFEGKEYAHRGLWSNALENKRSENSPAAFKAAAEKGIGVELDIQLTADKQVVVFHDANLKRVCGADIKVAELTYEELKAYPLPNGESIPLFSQVLDILGGVPIICEVKPGKTVSDTECCALAADMIESYKGDICIESFSPFAVKWFRENRPNIIRGQLSSRFDSEAEGVKGVQAFAMRHLLVNVLSRPDFIAYNYRRDSFGFKLCRALYSPFCVAWTARGGEERTAAAKRFDTVIFEEEPQKGNVL
ncbi:MAG: glycerophosphodiester phosphodiesterase [Oscillospiraceae bacterium]|nr:glycerophosphodiester phosphodiesterase [Oscillospiraceae bacterium]